MDKVEQEAWDVFLQRVKDENVQQHIKDALRFGYQQAIEDVKERLNVRFEEYKGYYNQTAREYFEGKMDALDMLEQDIDTLSVL